MQLTVVPAEDPAVVRERSGLGVNPYRQDVRWRRNAVSVNALFTGDELEDGGRADGWSVVNVRDGRDDNGGVTSHRGVTHPGEYIDEGVLQALAEEEFGYTREQVATVYSFKGRLPHELLPLRNEMDARILAVYEDGGNMLQFSKALGLNHRTTNRAIDRARKNAV